MPSRAESAAANYGGTGALGKPSNCSTAMYLDNALSKFPMTHAIVSTFGLLFLTLAAAQAQAQTQAWVQQLGTSSEDYVVCAARDGTGGVYVSGSTNGSLGGPNADPSGATGDAWLARFDSSGSQAWIRQFGTSAEEFVVSAAPDGSGGVYVCGATLLNLGGPSAGNYDAWLARYDGSGNRIWIRQFGTINYDAAHAVTQDGASGLFVAGYTNGSLGAPNAGQSDAWLARYDSAGNQTWVRQMGTLLYDSADTATSDGAGGVYVNGYTEASLGGASAGQQDAWIARYDSVGTRSWIRQLGTSGWEYATAASLDGSGGVFVGGVTSGSLGGPHAGGLYDAWLARYDGFGNQTWIRQFGGPATDMFEEAAPDGSGGVYLIGFSVSPTTDSWLAQFDGTGTQTLLQPIGTVDVDLAFAAAPDGAGGVYLGGKTTGNLGGPNSGSFDAWLARYVGACPVPTNYCAAKINSLGCTPAITSIGAPSATAGSGFAIEGTNVRNNKPGLLLYTKAGRTATPFGGGTLCLHTPLRRSVALTSGGSPAPSNDCSGVYSIDMNLFAIGALGGTPAGYLTIVGTLVDTQFWGRDSGYAFPNNVTLTAGLEFSVCP